MGDVSGLHRDSRHRSSCSLAERKEALQQVSIPEGDDRFILSDSRCEDFQAKLDMLHNHNKKKRKLKRHSMTRVMAPPMIEENLQPLISIQTQPKKKGSAQMSRSRPGDYSKAYLDLATEEQHRMIRAYNQNRNSYSPLQQSKCETDKAQLSRRRNSSTSPQKNRQEPRQGIQSELLTSYQKYYDNEIPGKEDSADDYGNFKDKTPKKEVKTFRRVPLNMNKQIEPRNSRVHHDFHTRSDSVNMGAEGVLQKVEGAGDDSYSEERDSPLSRKVSRTRSKWQNRRYELPTLASQMKNYDFRNLHSNYSNIPFIVSKSTEPSHNIGVNIQKVLNGLKMQQPVSRIPFTIAHRMGLRNNPIMTSPRSNVTNKFITDSKDLNVLDLGTKCLHLPTYKCMSFNRLLRLYQENDGIVSRFLRSLSQPNYYDAPVYNITPEEYFNGAMLKGRGGCQEARQSLTEYSRLYREYERLEKCLQRSGPHEELKKRKEELTRELAAREHYITKVIQEYKSSVESSHGTTNIIGGRKR